MDHRQPLLVRLLGWRRTRYFRRRPVYFSRLHCPYCGKCSVDQMPAQASVYFYDCARCRRILKPKSGLCCVYCSYGNMPCPPRQRGEYGRITTHQSRHWSARSVAPAAGCS